MNTKFFVCTGLSTFLVYFFLLFTNPVATINADVILTIPEGASNAGSIHFKPAEISVEKGDIIKVKNTDGEKKHSVVSGVAGSDDQGRIFSVFIDGGGTSIIDTQNIAVGQYPFFCSLHPFMTGGTLTVVPKPETPISTIIIGAIVAIAAAGGAIAFLKFRKKSKDGTDVIDVK
jgi:plastocyanin